MTIINKSSDETDNNHQTLSPSQRLLELQRRHTTTKCFVLSLILVGIPLFMVSWQDMPTSFPTILPVGDGIASAIATGKVSEDLSEMTETTVSNKLSHSHSHSNNNSTTANYNHSTTITSNTSTTSDSLPAMVWLMSFPNSGTSYTMRMVASVSNRAVATNYGPEFAEFPHPNIPVYPAPDGLPFQGPFWRGHEDEKPLPDKYILTKTHCGGRCVRCRPTRYVLTLSEFLHACTEGRGCLPPAIANNNTHNNKDSKNTTTHCQWKDLHYPPPPNNPRIAKLIHLIRNPFDNIVSRFHLARKLIKRMKQDDPRELNEWLDRHPDNAEGFQTWCQGLDDAYGSPLHGKHPSLPDIQHLNCLGEWFKYIQWHAMTFAIQKQTKDKLSSLTIYYEDYGRDWNTTTQTILDFLELERDETADVLEFVQGKSYEDYFTDEQRLEAKALVQKLTSKDLWQLIQPYF